MFPALLAQTSAQAAETAARTTYRLGWLPAYADERWRYAALAAVGAAVLGLVVYMYRRDAAELRGGVGLLLLGLRVVALAGLLVYFLDIEQRTERQVVNHSRVLLLVDTSQSMGFRDGDASAVPAAPSRIEQVVDELRDGRLIPELREVHDVTVVSFDRASEHVASFPKLVEGAAVEGDGAKPESAPASRKLDWEQALLPQGAETRLGQALKQLIAEEGATPVSAIVVISDGGQNAGVAPQSVIEAARAAQIPVHAVGVGSDRQPKNIRVADFVAPTRAYPGDAFTVTGYVQAQGLSGRAAKVELYSRDASDKSGPGVLEESRRVTLGVDGEMLPVKFELKPEAVGRRTYRLQIERLREDLNVNDNRQEADVEIVDRKTRVLLLAGGPTREYQFLRNQLRRDKDVTVDVLLQSAQPGISQGANEILFDFPSTKDDLYKYDAVVAFDPDWNALSAEQVKLLESWVAEEAGGLIAVAGPIYTDSWVRNPAMAAVRNLYPVEFYKRFTLLNDAEYGSTTPWPIEFTREGLEAEFLWIDDARGQSQLAWESFPGVYGYFSVKGPKPGATVYGRYSDPEAALGDELPVYFAGHFYGSGRVFYLGSGEMWRLRAVDPAYFEQFYTKLIRHASQGRLLRGSKQGALLVERDRYLLGNTVVVRAQLSDAQHEPLDLPAVNLQVTRPDSTIQTVVLKADPARKGMYGGQFTVLQEGAFRLDLPVPETIDDQLTRRIQVKVPDLERENPRRNDALLSEIALGTGGRYYIGLPAALGAGESPPLVAQLRDRTETTILSGAPNRGFEKQLMTWLLGVICGALCLEWLVRRLNKLA
jgi:hypothetical protein